MTFFISASHKLISVLCKEKSMKKINCIGVGTVTSRWRNYKEMCEYFSCGTYAINQTNSNIKQIKYPIRNKLFYILDMAFSEAVLSAKVDIKKNKRIGLVIATSLGNVDDKERNRLYEVSSYLIEKYAFVGQEYCVTNTCVSGVSALYIAELLLKSSTVDVCIVVAVDVISEFIYNGLNSISAMSSIGTLKPFSENRDGIVLGEGVGVVVLNYYESMSSDIHIIGCQLTNDAFHLLSPDPNADGMTMAITKLLDKKHISAKDIDCVMCCGTGTTYNDAMQAKAMSRVWGNKDNYITSIKPYVGHTLGASGIIELISTIFMMRNNVVYPIGCKYKSDCLPDSSMIFEKMEKPLNKVVILSSGFSGINGAVLLGKG